MEGSAPSQNMSNNLLKCQYGLICGSSSKILRFHKVIGSRNEGSEWVNGVVEALKVALGGTELGFKRSLQIWKVFRSILM